MSEHNHEPTTVKKKRSTYSQREEERREQDEQPREHGNLSFSVLDPFRLRCTRKDTASHIKGIQSLTVASVQLSVEIETSFQLYDVVTGTILEYLDISYEESYRRMKKAKRIFIDAEREQVSKIKARLTKPRVMLGDSIIYPSNQPDR